MTGSVVVSSQDQGGMIFGKMLPGGSVVQWVGVGGQWVARLPFDD